LIASLDVEEKAQAKDTYGKGQFSGNVVEKSPRVKNRGKISLTKLPPSRR